MVYLGTFSRTIAPAIRIGFMVLPDGLLKVYRRKLAFLACTVPRIDQAVLTEFILGGHYERHINKARKIYKSRHDKLISSLKVFGDKVKIMGGNAGMHLMVKFKLDMTEEEVVSRAEKSGIKLVGLSKHRIGESPESSEACILIGYGNISEDRIEEGIKILAKNLIS